MTVWFGGTVWCDKCVRPTHAKVEIQVGHGGKLRPVLPPGWRSLGSDGVHVCPKHPEGVPKVAMKRRKRS